MLRTGASTTARWYPRHARWPPPTRRPSQTGATTDRVSPVNPAVIGETWAADLLRAAARAPGVEPCDAVGGNDPQPRRSGQADRRPVLRGPPRARTSCHADDGKASDKTINTTILSEMAQHGVRPRASIYVVDATLVTEDNQTHAGPTSHLLPSGRGAHAPPWESLSGRRSEVKCPRQAPTQAGGTQSQLN